MKVSEVLNEFKVEKIDIGGYVNNERTVYRNPSNTELEDFLVKYKFMRGLLMASNFYVWDAFDMDHHSVKTAFGDESDAELFISKDEKEVLTWSTSVRTPIKIHDFYVGMACAKDFDIMKYKNVIRRAFGLTDEEVLAIFDKALIESRVRTKKI